MSQDPKEYYKILEVSPQASDSEIKHNYRQIAKVWHPDQNESEDALEMFQKIAVAYDVLKDEKKRLTYDLLSMIYTAKDFPEMFSLKTYKNKKGQEDLGIRSLRQETVIGKIYNFRLKNDEEICSFSEAKASVFKASLINWLLGWWSVKGFLVNLKVIFKNIFQIGKNTQDNLRLLIHNALAYQQEDKNEQAFLSGVTALSYASSSEKKLIKRFLEGLKITPQYKPQAWNFGLLKLIQLIIPFGLFLTLALSIPKKQLNLGEFYQNLTKDKEINYYQEVKHMRGRRGVDDVVVAKVFDIPVDTRNDAYLFHVNEKTKVLFAAGEEFDVVAVVEKSTTVRVTGYTPDKVWYRIMLDDGQMGFVRGNLLKKGIGKEIPEDSKIYNREIR
ncbi:MAG: DnaJ domain-containing protein [Alphaproteobacteria bacterium]|nr:DnaJ domain-containing protein [Alphaproteobacteria bacterium]